MTGSSGGGAGDLNDSPFACKSFHHSRSHLSLECTMFCSNTHTQMTFVTLCRSHRLSEYQFPALQMERIIPPHIDVRMRLYKACEILEIWTHDKSYEVSSIIGIWKHGITITSLLVGQI